MERAFGALIPADADEECFENTPRRAAKAWSELTASHGREIEWDELRTFPCDSDVVMEMKDIPVSSLCSHHLLPFVGKASVRYVTNKSAIGLSKIVRVVDFHSRRLQMQEALTRDIGTTLMRVLNADVRVVLECEHMCMRMRGVRAPEVHTRTEYVARRREEATATCQNAD